MSKGNGKQVTLDLNNPHQIAGICLGRAKEIETNEKPTNRDLAESQRIILAALGALFRQQAIVADQRKMQQAARKFGGGIVLPGGVSR
jgi:hypothetical protein